MSHQQRRLSNTKLETRRPIFIIALKPPKEMNLSLYLRLTHISILRGTARANKMYVLCFNTYIRVHSVTQPRASKMFR